MNYKRGILIGLLFGIIITLLTFLVGGGYTSIIPMMLLIVISLIFSWWYFSSINVQKGWKQGVMLGVIFVLIVIVLNALSILLLRSLFPQIMTPQEALGGVTTLGSLTQLFDLNYSSIFSISQLVSYIVIIVISVIMSIIKKDASNNQYQMPVNSISP